MDADDRNEAQRFHVGSTIAGRYRVERPIGEGAMGAVAMARHVTLDETVAIKFLRPELRRDPAAIGRLSREAKALARIKSDHVARVLDVGATLSVGPYMVMEYLEGTDLGELLDEEGPLPASRAVECVLQLCEALTVAHTAGIVHRDIKPQNLFLARHGQFETLKVLDFGICDGAVASVPGAADVMPYGTPSYMSPERVRNDASADHRADIWSIGVVLHELVTGRAVFDGGELTDICGRIVSDAPIVLEADVTLLPPELRVIIGRCLERDPARRYQSVEELAAALAPLATMHERFRGRTTGAFSRHLLDRELANARSLAPLVAPVAPEPRPTGPSRAPLAVGSARLGRAVSPRALALAAACIVIVASLVRGAAWMTPPALSGATPSATSAAGTSAAGTSAALVAPGPARFASELAPTGSAPLLPVPPLLAADAARSEALGSGEASSALRAEPRQTRARAKARATRSQSKRPLARRASESRARNTAVKAGATGAPVAVETRRTHASRVRLVDDERASSRVASRATSTPRRSTSRRSTSRRSTPRDAERQSPVQPDAPRPYVPRGDVDGSETRPGSEPPRRAEKDDGRASAEALPDGLRSSQIP